MAESDPILHNTHKNMQIEVFAADGDSIHLMPGAKEPVDPKFLWRLPKHVTEYEESHTVFGKKTREVSDVKKSGNLKGVEDDRETLNSDVVPEKPNTVKMTS